MSSPVAPQVTARIQIAVRESWRSTPPPAGSEFRFPLVVDGLSYIARFSVSDGAALACGVPTEVPIEFMFPDKALPKFTPGTHFTIWDGKDIGTGEMVTGFLCTKLSFRRERFSMRWNW